MRRAFAIALALIAVVGCRRGTSTRAHRKAFPGPSTLPVEVVLLGTAQDGGLPHVGCHAPPCERARRDASFRRMVVSLGIVDRIADKRFLVEATPDLPQQLDRLDAFSGGARPRGQNPIDAVLLTHGHIGHYAGLVHFGREVAATHSLALYGTDRMLGYLRGAGPWSLLFELHQVEPHAMTKDEPVQLSERLRVTAIAVPHREEFTDTVAFRFEGPTKKLLFLPDIDRWDEWERRGVRVEDAVASVDIALLDATFYGEGEVPGRKASEIPHPLVTDTIARLRSLASKHRIVLVHLNHSNPLADPKSDEARIVREAGLEIGADGMRFAL